MVSICMTYKNRKRQFLQTIKSINHSEYKDFEVIVIDDASDSDNRIEDVAEEFKFIKLTRIESSEKTWKNPCIPYNMAFKQAKGDKIIIQNAECAHCGDIISLVEKNQKPKEYLSFGCISLPHILTEKYCSEDYFGKGDFTEITNIASGLGQPANFDGDFGWYNHPLYIARGIHFCNSILTKDLKELGGFDERFSDGYNWDDNELIWRISSKGFKVGFIPLPFVVHLYHYTDCSTDMDPNKAFLVDKNAKLFDLIQRGIFPMWSRVLE